MRRLATATTILSFSLLLPVTAFAADIVWEVQDNGQGIAAPPDKVSNVQPGVAPGTCNSMPDLGLIDWTNGNVQVQ